MSGDARPDVSAYVAASDRLGEIETSIKAGITRLIRITESIEQQAEQRTTLRDRWVSSWRWDEVLTITGTTTVILMAVIGCILAVRWNLDVPNDKFFLNDAGQRCMTTVDPNGGGLWPSAGYNDVLLCEVPR